MQMKNQPEETEYWQFLYLSLHFFVGQGYKELMGIGVSLINLSLCSANMMIIKKNTIVQLL